MAVTGTGDQLLNVIDWLFNAFTLSKSSGSTIAHVSVTDVATAVIIRLTSPRMLEKKPWLVDDALVVLAIIPRILHGSQII